MSRTVTITPAPIAVGLQIEERRQVERAWSDRRDHALSGGAPVEVAYRLTHASTRRETVEAATRVSFTRLALRYDAWHESVTVGDTPRERSLAGSWVVSAAPGRVTAEGEGSAEERQLVEFEYAALGAVEPVFTAAPLAPVPEGCEVESLGLLVRGLLYRCLRGAVGYTADLPLAVHPRLVEVRPGGDGGDGGRFTVRVEPTPEPAPIGRLELDGELVIGGNGWPTLFAVTGSIQRRYTERSGGVTLDGQLTLRAEWSYRF